MEKQKDEAVLEVVSEEEEDKKKHKKKEGPMAALLADSPNPPAEGDLIEGPIIKIEKSKVYVDLAPFGTGIIYGREYLNAREILRKANIGDTISAKIVETANKQGYIELSLKEARQAVIWSEAEQAINNKNVFELAVKDRSEERRVGKECRSRW